ncbi:MAG TPA: RNA polymerase sigma-54 factor, partial [Rhizorhapis sp.]|nr:RNA polymerase sigma-54 factor [Rhizorhapis sp.]
MALGPRLDIRQSQSLVMTPQLQQAIKLLALSNLEIDTFVAGELEKNPLLEAAAPVDPAPAPGGIDAEVDRPVLAAETGGADDLIGQGLGEADAPLDVDYSAETFIDDGPGDRVAAAVGSGGADLYAGSGEATDFDSFANPEQGLQEHLMDQARSALSGMDLTVATQLIGQIDETGYLEANLLQTAHGLGVPLS